MADDELWDLRDADGELSGGTHRRGVGMPVGAFHAVAGTCVVRSDGFVLVTLRSESKEYPLTWEFPSGSALTGETSQQAAVRELREETGLRARPDSVRLVGRSVETSALFDFYVSQVADADALAIDGDEVSDAEWLTLDDVARRLDDGLMAAPWTPRLAQFWPRLVELVHGAAPGASATA